MGSNSSKRGLSEFQKEKLLHDFRTFYDINGDGRLTWADFEKLQERTCKLNNWKRGSRKFETCEQDFKQIWDAITTTADKNADEVVTNAEWLNMWEELHKKILAETKGSLPRSDNIPYWLHQHLLHRFQLYDRTGDGIIDRDEFEYVLSHFNVPAPDCKKCFMIFSENESKQVKFEEFVNLALEFYFSDDPSALGNFISGKLEYMLPRKK